jgi:uncharacterized protein (DUF1810 family)
LAPVNPACEDAFMLDATLFLQAQDGCIDTVYAELRAGRKASHWMWFIFPQLKVLGRSQMAMRYGLSDLAEAKAYLAHPVLGERLRQCTRLVCSHTGKSAHDIMGSPDDLKLRSCMTLFAQAAPGEALFTDVLARFYAGEPCVLTMQALGSA